MPKYTALVLLTDLATNQYIRPGETFEIPEDEADRAKILLAAGLIKPAEAASKIIKEGPKEAKEQ